MVTGRYVDQVLIVISKLAIKYHHQSNKNRLMTPTEAHINVLVHLSMVDKHLAEEESKVIHKIGERNGLSTQQVDEIIKHPQPIPSLKDLHPEEKFEYLFNVIFLMKVDGKIFQSEIQFCEKVAIALGYKPGVIADLSVYIYSDENINTNKSFLRSIADRHLVPMSRK